MDNREAIRWLDEHGGRWWVRATQATCFVIATLGPAKVQAPIRSLRATEVNEALVAAVMELQDRTGDDPQS